jgi:hypothetical protein
MKYMAGTLIRSLLLRKRPDMSMSIPIKSKRGIPGDFLAPYGVSKHAADLYIQDHYSYGLRLGAFR